MDMKALEANLKILSGEDVTEDERNHARAYNNKYALVRHLVMEKLASDKKTQLTDFHFTPGEEFVSIPAIDVANAVIDSLSKLSDAKPMNFGDGRWIENPPVTGSEKKQLI